MQPGVLQSRKDLHVRYDLMLLVLVRVLLKRALADSNMEVAFPIEEARFDLASWGSGWFLDSSSIETKLERVGRCNPFGTIANSSADDRSYLSRSIIIANGVWFKSNPTRQKITCKYVSSVLRCGRLEEKCLLRKLSTAPASERSRLRTKHSKLSGPRALSTTNCNISAAKSPSRH